MIGFLRFLDNLAYSPRFFLHTRRAAAGRAEELEKEKEKRLERLAQESIQPDKSRVGCVFVCVRAVCL